MSKSLKVTYGSMTYEMEEVGSFTWQENENGSITLTASPPGVAATARGAGASRGLGSLGDVASPVLKRLASDLKEKSQASAELAREKAEAQEAAKAAPVAADG